MSLLKGNSSLHFNNFNGGKCLYNRRLKRKPTWAPSTVHHQGFHPGAPTPRNFWRLSPWMSCFPSNLKTRRVSWQGWNSGFGWAWVVGWFDQWGIYINWRKKHETKTDPPKELMFWSIIGYTLHGNDHISDIPLPRHFSIDDVPNFPFGWDRFSLREGTKQKQNMCFDLGHRVFSRCGCLMK